MVHTRYGVALLAALVVASCFASARAPEELEALRVQAERLFREGRYAEALATQRMVGAGIEKAETAEAGAPAKRTAEALSNLAWYALFAREHSEALAASERARALAPELLVIETNRAHALLFLDRASDAREVYLALKGKRLDPSSDKTWEDAIAEDFGALGGADLRHPAFAEILAALGIKNPEFVRDIATVRKELEQLYAAGKYTDAVAAAGRLFDLARNRFGEERSEVAAAMAWLGLSLEGAGRSEEAEASYKRSLAIYERALGPQHQEVARVLYNLAQLHRSKARHSEAEHLLKRSLVVLETTLGPEHYDTTSVLNSLATLYEVLGRDAEAVPLYQRSQAIIEKALGPVHPSRVQLLWRLLRIAHRVATESNSINLAAQMFETAQHQWPSAAADSFVQMASRSAKGSPELAELVRERQDIVAELVYGRRAGRHRADAGTSPSDRAAAVRARLTVIDQRLAREFPDYHAFASLTSSTVAEVQALLGVQEAMVLFLDADIRYMPDLDERLRSFSESFLWVVTKSEVRWIRLGLGTNALKREVAALRCGLDRAAWTEDSGAKCGSLLNITSDKLPKDDEPLPLDVARAHALYKTLFGQVEDLLRGKHLLIVPSGPLAQLPFHVLVTEPVEGIRFATDLRRVAWLVRKHAVTVLPAVSSLKALRRVASPSAATRPMVGFGNPLLDGDPIGRPWEAEWVNLSREKQSCPPTLWQRVAGFLEKRRSVHRVGMRNGHADLEHLRFQAPLHETADELCAVARDLRLEHTDILLGAKATETNVKQLSSDGKLSAYRVVHFATHGTVAGEIEGTTEPGLILTPPDTATDFDDGYLSASEVASLKLDADWVVLSACNTAAAGAESAEALSGLARAFIYAGARSLLVSHWAVPSAATAKLVSTAVGATARVKQLGRAEALRRAMLAMIDQGEPYEAHPAFWAAFVVIGEGSTGR